MRLLRWRPRNDFNELRTFIGRASIPAQTPGDRGDFSARTIGTRSDGVNGLGRRVGIVRRASGWPRRCAILEIKKYRSVARGHREAASPESIAERPMGYGFPGSPRFRSSPGNNWRGRLIVRGRTYQRPILRLTAFSC